MRRTIGCDTGKNFGICVLDGTKITHMIKSDFWLAYEFILEFKPSETLVVLEMSTKKITFHGKDSYFAGRDAGHPYWQARLLKDKFTDLGYAVLTEEPSGQGKDMNHEFFSRHYGWERGSNEHNRDAYFTAIKWSRIWQTTPEAIREMIHASKKK